MKKFTLLFVGLLYMTFLSGQVTNGLIAKYYFNDNTLNDEVGDIDGISHNTLFTSDRFLNPGNALGFDAEMQSNVSFGDSFDEIFATPDSQFSFSIWIKRRDTSSTRTAIISKYGNSNCWEDQREFTFLLTENKELQFLYYSSFVWTEYRSILGSTIIEDTLWHHIVLNYDGSQDGNDGQDRVRIFVDNHEDETVLAASGVLGDMQDGSAHLSLGVPLGSSGNICFPNFFNGVLDDIRFYNRNLTEAEVDSLFNEADPSFSIHEYQSIPEISAYPNPFTTATTLEYMLEGKSKIQITIYNSIGELVYEMYEHMMPQGSHKVSWSTGHLSTGLYYAVLRTEEGVSVVKMVKQ